MTDIITKRLRSDGLLGDCSEAIELCREAADEIDRLRDERDFQEMGWRNQTAVAERLRALIEEVLDKEMSAHEWKIWAATANGILSEMQLHYEAPSLGQRVRDAEDQMTDSLKERLRALAARREMEGIYTDRNIAELALARIEELEHDNLQRARKTPSHLTDLIEKVARAIWEADGLDQGEWATIPNPKGLTKEARAAIAMVLREQGKWHPGPGGVDWCDAIKAFARENGIEL